MFEKVVNGEVTYPYQGKDKRKGIYANKKYANETSNPESGQLAPVSVTPWTRITRLQLVEFAFSACREVIALVPRLCFFCCIPFIGERLRQIFVFSPSLAKCTVLFTQVPCDLVDL